ncbi:MAG: SRPBCC domain-containing protein [bacterium]
MTPAPSYSTRLSRTIRASREQLFSAWTEPEKVEGWWRMNQPGWAFALANIDLRVGGRYRLGMTDPDGKLHVAVGEYREIERPARLAFTWNWENPLDSVGDTLVTIEFRDTGENTTELVLTHERFTDPARAASHERGWVQLFTLLEHLIEEE